MSEFERSSEYISADRAGLKITFHPAFARVCTVAEGDSAEERVYQQSDPYPVPSGFQGAPKKHRIRVEGGPHQREVELVVTDSGGQVAEIVIKLHQPGHVHGTGSGSKPLETVRLLNDAVHCPPNCL